MSNTTRGRGRPATGKLPKRQLGAVDDETWDLYQQAADAAGAANRAVWMKETLTRAAKRLVRKNGKA